MNTALFVIALLCLVILGHVRGLDEISKGIESNPFGECVKPLSRGKKTVLYIWGFLTVFGVAGCGWIVFGYLID